MVSNNRAACFIDKDPGLLPHYKTKTSETLAQKKKKKVTEWTKHLDQID